MIQPTLLTPSAYPELAPVLATCHGQTLDLAAEALKDYTRVWVMREPKTDSVLSFVLSWWTEGQAEVVDLATLPRARRQGHARKLMQRVIETARTTPGTNVWLEVRRWNHPAVRLYETLGFAVSRTRRGYYADGEDALEMVLELSP